MASPEFVDLPADEWTLVAENKTKGQIVFVSGQPERILKTYVQPTGGAAPDPIGDFNLGVPAFRGGLPENLSDDDPTDFYLFSKGAVSRVWVAI